MRWLPLILILDQFLGVQHRLKRVQLCLAAVYFLLLNFPRVGIKEHNFSWETDEPPGYIFSKRNSGRKSVPTLLTINSRELKSRSEMFSSHNSISHDYGKFAFWTRSFNIFSVLSIQFSKFRPHNFKTFEYISK